MVITTFGGSRAQSASNGSLSNRTMSPSAPAQATRKLGQIKEPAKARAVVDEMERILGDARRALSKLEQAEKQKKTKTPIKK